MNWVGGVRSRLHRKNEKKIQQQFFEQKRQEKKYGIKKRFSPRKEGFSISQDMLSLHTVLKAHDPASKKKGIYIETKKPCHVDLDYHTPSRVNHNKSTLSMSPVETNSQIDFHKASDNCDIQRPYMHYKHGLSPKDIIISDRRIHRSIDKSVTPFQRSFVPKRVPTYFANRMSEPIREEADLENHYSERAIFQDVKIDISPKKEPSYFNLFKKDSKQERKSPLLEKSSSKPSPNSGYCRNEFISLKKTGGCRINGSFDTSEKVTLLSNVEIFNPYSTPGPHSQKFKISDDGNQAKEEGKIELVGEDLRAMDEMSPFARRKLDQLLDDDSCSSSSTKSVSFASCSSSQRSLSEERSPCIVDLVDKNDVPHMADFPLPTGNTQVEEHCQGNEQTDTILKESNEVTVNVNRHDKNGDGEQEVCKYTENENLLINSAESSHALRSLESGISSCVNRENESSNIDINSSMKNGRDSLNDVKSVPNVVEIKSQNVASHPVEKRGSMIEYYANMQLRRLKEQDEMNFERHQMVMSYLLTSDNNTVTHMLSSEE